VNWEVVVINYFILSSLLEVCIQFNVEVGVCWRVVVINYALNLFQLLENT
jgi:hypothetical protein